MIANTELENAQKDLRLKKGLRHTYWTKGWLKWTRVNVKCICCVYQGPVGKRGTQGPPGPPGPKVGHLLRCTVLMKSLFSSLKCLTVVICPSLIRETLDMMEWRVFQDQWWEIVFPLVSQCTRVMQYASDELLLLKRWQEHLLSVDLLGCTRGHRRCWTTWTERVWGEFSWTSQYSFKPF